MRAVEEFDEEWLELVLLARHIGLTVEEVRTFLRMKEAVGENNF
ncbi:anti-repressor SinI family protein [Alicyclobacillus cycloheptanicus]|nr:anti-repressor SinI family protein [Alicyclobacillus cycloheptanicus]